MLVFRHLSQWFTMGGQVASGITGMCQKSRQTRKTALQSKNRANFGHILNAPKNFVKNVCGTGVMPKPKLWLLA